MWADNMPFIVVLVGALIAIAAFNNAHQDLGHALQTDVPAYFKWAIAIAAILGLGYIPGMKVPSRWLIALVALVVVLTNYQTILAGFTQFASSSPGPVGAGSPDPTSAYVASGGASGTPTTAQVAGNATAAPATQAGIAAASAVAANPLNPNTYIGLAAGFGGLA